MPFTAINHLFVAGLLFAALDAYNIGANDVANSFATSVSSRSLTLRQACLAAAVCEFLGAVLAGARVAGTIKNNIVSLSAFYGRADLQALAFTCALIVSASWLMIATRLSFPVSTTYSIVSAIAGVGIAVGGFDAVQWGWNDGRGLATIFAGLGIAPALAAGFAAVAYMLVYLLVLIHKDPVRWALYTAPFWFFTVTVVLTLSIIYKGSPKLGLADLSPTTIGVATVVTALVIAGLSLVFWLPFVHAKVVRKDYTIRFYDFFQGPLLWKRQPPADAGTIGAQSAVPDYRFIRDDQGNKVIADVNKTGSEHGSDEKVDSIGPIVPEPNMQKSELARIERVPWYYPSEIKQLPRRIIAAITYGSSRDIHEMQRGETTKEQQRMAEIHARSKQYDNEVEHLYSFLQVMTACTASFAHGANDVSNAVGPLAAIYEVWSTSEPLSSRTPTPVWILAFGGIMIVIGLATYGYNIMAVLGNKITLLSPTRGMSAELGAATTVILATIYGLPVSTTMCITGGTIGVGLCTGNPKAVNWRSVAWIYLGWIVTVPIVMIISYGLMAFIIRSPAI